MISDEDGGSGFFEVTVRIDDFEGHADRSSHDVLEESCCRPLRDLSMAENAQDDGRDDAIQGRHEQGNVRSQASGGEGCFGRHRGYSEESEGQDSVASQEVSQVGEKGHVWPTEERWEGEEMEWSDTEVRATGNQIMVSMCGGAIDGSVVAPVTSNPRLPNLAYWSPGRGAQDRGAQGVMRM